MMFFTQKASAENVSIVAAALKDDLTPWRGIPVFLNLFLIYLQYSNAAAASSLFKQSSHQ